MTKHKREFPVTQQSQQISRIQATAFAGPLPPPADLERYGQIFPGCAERIVAMAESQSKHRQELETMVVKGNLRNATIGPVCGLVICLAALGLGTYLIMQGKSAEGISSILAALCGPAAIFVGTYWKQKRELEKKAGAFGPAPFKP